MPIRNYGLKWQYGRGMTGTLLGGNPVDLSKQLGIYVIYRGEGIVYVGKSARSDKSGIYGRLKGHKEDGWTFKTYSWFGVLPVDSGGALSYLPDNLTIEELTTNLEALLIHLLAPAWNGNGGQYKHIPMYEQCDEI